MHMMLGLDDKVQEHVCYFGKQQKITLIQVSQLLFQLLYILQPTSYDLPPCIHPDKQSETHILAHTS